MKRPDESGFILALALVMLVMGSVIIVPSMSTASNMLRINRLSETNTAATYAAEAGIADVMWKFNNNQNPTFPYTLPNPVNGLTVTISEAKPAEADAFAVTYTLDSAASQQTQVKGRVMLQIVHVTGASPFYYGLVSLNGDITMSNSAMVYSTPAGHGDVFANGNIHAYNSSQIAGNAAATGTIDSSHVTGTSSPHQPAKDFQDMDMTWYTQQANSGGYITGNLNLSNVSNYQLGPKHITGNLYISGTSTVRLNGVVWVDGTIAIANSSRINGTSYLVANGNISMSNTATTPDNPTFISNNGNITLSNSAIIGSLYAPNGSVSIANSMTVNGSIVAKSISMANSAKVNYPLNLQTNPPPGFSGGNSTTITSASYY
jgi:hypothetical protein